MAFFTMDYYSHAMALETTVTVLFPSEEAAAGQPTLPKAFDGVWLLTRPGGRSTDWLLRTRHVEAAGEHELVILLPWHDCPGYDRFLTEELPTFLSGCGLQYGAAHNLIGAHPESADEAIRLAEHYPRSFGAVLPQWNGPEQGWQAADRMITEYCVSKYGPASVRK